MSLNSLSTQSPIDNREAFPHDSFGVPQIFSRNQKAPSIKKKSLYANFPYRRELNPFRFSEVDPSFSNTMSNSRRANVFAALAKRQHFASLWHGLESRSALAEILGGELRCLSSNASSSRHYDRSNVTRSNRISPAKPLNGIPRSDSNRKRAIVPSEKNKEISSQSTLHPFKQARTMNKSKSETPKVDGKNAHSAHVSPSELVFTGDTVIPVTSRLHIVTPEEDTPRGVWPIFRMMVSH